MDGWIQMFKKDGSSGQWSSLSIIIICLINKIYFSSKKKKRKKDKKHSSKNKKKRKRDNEAEEEEPPVVNIDLTNTLKELRSSSPTKELGLQDVDNTPQRLIRQKSSDEELVKVKRKMDREYSEGEWSSDSEGDSKSSISKDD